MNIMLNRIYYTLRPLIPRKYQILLRSWLVTIKRRRLSEIWPIDENAGTKPAHWNGWPDGKQFALILTHDVDTARGHDRCYDLAELECDMGFCSSFNFVPERYQVCQELLHHLVSQGFEAGVHGLLHDGKLYSSKDIFLQRARKINQYLSQWNAVGFRSPSMQHNLDWIHQLNILYDASTFDTDPFEPQADGVRTIFPFIVSKKLDESVVSRYVELPYTLPQDFTLFILMRETTPDIWKQKLDWIVQKGGMAFLNTHPDYMYFGKGRRHIDDYQVEIYIDFLNYIKTHYSGTYWHVLPKQMAQFWLKDHS